MTWDLGAQESMESLLQEEIVRLYEEVVTHPDGESFGVKAVMITAKKPSQS